jgi:hypothetical protein
VTSRLTRQIKVIKRAKRFLWRKGPLHEPAWTPDSKALEGKARLKKKLIIAVMPKA